MKSVFIAAVITACALAGDRVSTAEERVKAAAIAHALESAPFGKDAKRDRKWALNWVSEVSDVTVKLCGGVTEAIAGEISGRAPEIGAQLVLSAAAFAIEHPEQAQDSAAMQIAAIEGVLRTYEAILKNKPKARLAELDRLISRRDEGALADEVRARSQSCR